MISLLCEIQSNDTNELIYKQTHRHGKLMVTKAAGEG